jgi:hypothetical protein
VGLVKKLLPFYMINEILNLQTILLIKKLNQLNNIWNIKFSTFVHAHSMFRSVCSRWKLMSEQLWKLLPLKSTSLLKAHAIKLIKLMFNDDVYILVFTFCKRYSIWIKKMLCFFKNYNIYSIQFLRVCV